MTTSTPEKTDGLKALETAIEKIEETIKKLGGVFQTKMAVSDLSLISLILIKLKFSFQPKVVTAIDEADLARRMERAEIENAEVDGDDDDEEEENEEGIQFNPEDEDGAEEDDEKEVEEK